MQVDLNLTQNEKTNGPTQNGTGSNGEKLTNGVTEQANGVPKRKLTDENEDMPEKKLKLEDLAKNDVPKTEEVKMETEEVKEEKITIEEIRRLKEILRQEDAKLQLIKKIKATINPPSKTKSVPKIEAKVKNENGINTNGLKPVATVQIRKPEPNRLNQTDPLSGSTGIKLNSLRANSPMLQTDKVSVQTTAASYEKNRARKDLLKQQLNKTLKEITQAPPPPSTDVNFFPSATNNEFLVLLGLEMCVNRLKRDDNTDNSYESYSCAGCDRDFSPAWKIDPEGRRLCQKCYNNIQMKDLTKVQEGKFKQFKAFWNEKEQELKEIDFQLQKDEEAIRAQRVEAEKERIRREQERNKKLEAQRLKAKEEAAKNAKTGLNQWKNLGLNQQALLDQLVRQQQQKAKGSSSSSSSSNLNSQLGSATQQQQLARTIAQLSNGGNNKMNEQLLMQIQQLASNSGSNRTNHLSNHLASIHTQMLKQELLRRQEKLRQDREEAEKQRQQAAIEQFRQQQALEQARRAQQSKQSQQSSQEATLLRNVLAIQQLIGSNRGNQNVNQQLQNLLQNSNPATTQALLAAIQQQQRSGGKS